jgi:two-component system, NtrC family, sensor kinase
MTARMRSRGIIGPRRRGFRALMGKNPTLNRELVAALATVFAGALVVAVAGVLILLPRFETPTQAAAYIALMLAGDIAVFALFGRWLVQSRLLRPLERLMAEVEAIADGDYTRTVPSGGPDEVSRLADAVNRMAARLIRHQEQLTANIQSLEQTNRQLTDARDELVRAEKMASVGRLAAGIAHEIGNPLGAIMGYLGLLERGGEDLTDLAKSAEREAQRIDRIVRGLLDFARRRETKPRPMDVNAVIRSTVELLTDQGKLKHVDTRTLLSDDVSLVVADPYHLEQVLVNLLLNACDAMETSKAPAIVVETKPHVIESPRYMPSRRRDDPDGVDYSHRRRFNRPPWPTAEHPFAPGSTVVRIEVADNGPGIPNELFPEIFEPFVTTKEPGRGTGLGLAVSAGLIDAMGGTIQAENREDGGARFRILLPAAETQVGEMS